MQLCSQRPEPKRRTEIRRKTPDVNYTKSLERSHFPGQTANGYPTCAEQEHAVEDLNKRHRPSRLCRGKTLSANAASRCPLRKRLSPNGYQICLSEPESPIFGSRLEEHTLNSVTNPIALARYNVENLIGVANTATRLHRTTFTQEIALATS
jgi:hypothetical protein